MKKTYNNARKDDKSPGLLDVVFSWTLKDALDQNLYKDKVL